MATDEESFLNDIQEVFAGKIFATSSFRSTDHNPVHINSKNPYQSGEEALIDCLLLSKSDVLIRCMSHLSLWASYLNPDISMITLNEGYESTYRKY